MRIDPSASLCNLLQSYAGTFSDGAPPNWKFKRQGNNWEISFPNSAVVRTEDLLDPKTWSVHPEKDANTTILWRNSLAYLPRLIESAESDEETIELVAQIVESFIAWQDMSISLDIDSLRSGSLDHQSALRIRSLLWIISYLERNLMQEVEKFRELYGRMFAAENRLLSEFSLFQPNNHGIMLGIAHLHAETLMPSPESDMNALKWIEALYSTFNEIIDSDGIASENTPSYQIFYVMLLEDLVLFIAWSRMLGTRARLFQLLLRSAELGVRRQLLPSGAVPPLGDSPGGMQYRFKPVLGLLYSPENGLAVRTSSNEYIAYIAGFRSVIHKQIDDLSFSWWRNGRFILRDAGLLNYDTKDQVAVDMRGSKGHSLPTYRNLDSWTTKNTISYGRNSSRLRAEFTGVENSSSNLAISAKLHLDDSVIITRSLEHRAELGVKIVDSFLASNRGEPLVRFLLDPETIITYRQDGDIGIRSGEEDLRVCFKASSGILNFDINPSFVALEHNRKAKTNEIVLTVTSAEYPVRVETSIVITNHGKCL
ncbi:hypothetical protein GcLGCM259_1192 [Glutamicibacter creatinolyticus]|uniref:Heparinase II/III-like C-terminal domain-containing protein n=1 Tax=Glutamicibacter creatinolyticus TaxID=162496 RepID=A0A5B7WV37_9MICC|nr:heparinase II/III family protein [Glutamicibacter creatinolyticus]QCY46933.1 hypothetical protein GcLGCM259_1192 [Glutamicibacter creatinolyticus]